MSHSFPLSYAFIVAQMHRHTEYLLWGSNYSSIQFSMF